MDLHTQVRSQYTWTVLPQGFRDSPHLFRQALTGDMRDVSFVEATILQYVDDLLIYNPDKESSDQCTITLNFLSEWRY